MPSRRTKQVRHSKGNEEYYRRQRSEASTQTAISSILNALVIKAMEGDEIEPPSSPAGQHAAGPAVPPTSTVGPSRVLARVNRCAIEEVMAGDGSTVVNKDFEEGEFFAASSSQNSIESFYQIRMSSYCSPAWKNAAFIVHAETAAAKARSRLPSALVPRIHKSNYRRATTIIRNKVRAWCLDHPGFSLSKRGPGARGKSTVSLQHYTERQATVFQHGLKSACLPSALVNAVEIIAGPTLARSVQSEVNGLKGPLNSIGHYQRLMHKVAPGYNLRKIQDSSFTVGKFKWIAALNKGVWIVRLRGSNSLDHCVVVDGQKQEIIDSEERRPLRLCEASLRACRGDDAEGLYIAEVREMYKSSKATQIR